MDQWWENVQMDETTTVKGLKQMCLEDTKSNKGQCSGHQVNKGQAVGDAVRGAAQGLVQIAKLHKTFQVVQRETKGVTEGSELEEGHDLVDILAGSLQLLCWEETERDKIKRETD